MSRHEGGTKVDNRVEGNDNQVTQVGVVNGGAVFHGDSTVYQVAGDDPPERKYEVARNHLAGGSPRIAEGLLTEAIRGGLESTALAYHYALATLSERSINQLGAEQFDQIKTASLLAARFPRDLWRDAIDVIHALMRCVTEQENSREPDRAALDAVLAGFKTLPKDHQEEITRHLDMIIGGATQDMLDKENARDIAQARSSGDRAGRAWKFFEATPAEPRLVATLEDGRASAQTWLRAVVGTVALSGGLVLPMVAADPGAANAVAALLALAVLAHGTAVWLGVRAVAARRRRKRLEIEYGTGRLPEGLTDLGRLGSGRFRADVRRLIDREVVRRRPRKRTDRHSWWEDTERSAETLYLRLVRTYGSVIPDWDNREAHKRALAREISAWKLHWLIRMHVERWAVCWADGDFFAFRRVTRAEAAQDLLGLLCAVIAIAAAVGAYAVLDVALTFGPASITTVLGGLVGGIGCMELFGRRTAAARERAERRAVLAEERTERVRRQEELADRPSDAEMARWFDFDKAHLKAEAMQQAKLSNREVIAHVVLAEGLPWAKRARVIYGPPRYSKYHFVVFLLTESGVREFRVDLEFDTGTVRNWQRASFSYGALVLVEVLEVGVHFADDQRKVVVGPGDGETTPDKRRSSVRARALFLSLQNNRSLCLVVENFEELRDKEEEDERRLEDLALGSSGIASALRILETVAVEGRGWIAEERRRRDRGFEDWKRAEESAVPSLVAGPHRGTPDDGPLVVEG